MSEMETRMSTSMPRLARAAFFAAAVTLSSAACPAIATAAPVWDIEEYDYCMRQTGGIPPSPGEDPIEKEEENDRYCCHRSGGVWNGITCATPPAEAEAAPLGPSGPKAGLPGLKVQPPIVGTPNPTRVRPDRGVVLDSVS